MRSLCRLAVLKTAIGPEFWIRLRGPLALRDVNEPEPDISVVPGSPCDYHAHPKTALLAVEVSDATRSYDLRVKAKLYAASQGIPEYWVVDLVDRRLYVMRQPREGEYRQVECLEPSATVTPSALPAKAIAVGDLFR